jgi:hypothetical protein
MRLFRFFSLVAVALTLGHCPAPAQKISDLPALTSAASGDLLIITDVSDTTSAASGTTKKITLANVSLALSPSFANLTGKPTTLSGYGITDAQPLDADLTTWAAITRASWFDVFAATPSSANLATLVTNETGTGALVFGTGPTITLANATGLPISTGVSGLGTGVATFLATPSSANLAAAVTNETGTGALVFGTGPTLTLDNATGLPLTTGVTGTLGESNGGTGVTSLPYFRVRHSTAQAVADSTDTTALWNTEDSDTANVFASNTFTAPRAGKLESHVHLIWDSFPSGTIVVRLKVNGTTYSAARGPGSPGISSIALDDVIPVSNGDAVTVEVWHNSGSSQTIYNDQRESRWSGRLHP